MSNLSPDQFSSCPECGVTGKKSNGFMGRNVQEHAAYSPDCHVHHWSGTQVVAIDHNTFAEREAARKPLNPFRRKR